MNRAAAAAMAGVLTAALWAQASPDLVARYDDALGRQRSDPAAARVEMQALLPAFRDSKDHARLARGLETIAECAIALGDYRDAIQAAREAQSIYLTLQDHFGHADALNAEARAHISLGETKEGETDLRSALQSAGRAGKTEALVINYSDLGGVLFFDGRYEESLQAYRTAIKLMDQAPPADWMPHRRSILTANLAALYQRLGRNQGALDLYLGLRKNAPLMKPSEEAQLLANLGALYRRLGDPYKALETYRTAQELFRKERHVDRELSVLKNIGIVQALSLNDLPASLETFTAARRVAQDASNRRQLAQCELYLAEAQHRLGRHAEAGVVAASALQHARANKSKEDEWRALYLLGRLSEETDSKKALGLYRESIAVIESVRAGLELLLLRREFLADKRDVYDAAIGLLLRDKAQPQEIFELMEKSRSRVLQDSLPDASLAAVQQRLAPGQVLAEVWERENRMAILFVSQSGVSLEQGELPDTRGFLQALEDERKEWKEVARQLGARLLGQLPGKTEALVVVPDGRLHQVPFEALFAPHQNVPLVEQMPVWYLPSAAMLMRDRKTAGSRGFRKPWDQTLLAVADPFGDSQGAGRASQGSGEQWDPLPASRREVKAAAGAVGGRTEILEGKSALKPLFLARLPGFPLIHLATHGQANPQDPEGSRILFNSETGPDSLFLREIYSLDLRHVELMVASACSTEAGTLIRGEGVEGFSRAFLTAGAGSAVTTLWRVSDQATANLMQRFYGRLSRGDQQGEALRQAKLALLRAGGVHSHPKFWAPFLLNGEGGASIATVPSLIPLLVVVAAGVAAGWWLLTRDRRNRDRNADAGAAVEHQV